MSNIVILANIEWGFLKQRHQHIALGLAQRGHRVTFVESTAKRNPTWSDIPRIFDRLFARGSARHKKKQGRDSGEVVVITPFVLPSTWGVFRIVNKWFVLTPLIRRISSAAGGVVDVVINYTPSETSLELWRKLGRPTLVYDCVSNFSAVAGMPKDVDHTEGQVCQAATTVIVDCEYLNKKLSKKHSSVHQLGPGVDYRSFSAATEPTRLIKRIAYFGLISDKLDVDLINLLAKHDWSIALIGDTRTSATFHPNVKILPPVDHADLPQTLAEYDALIIPYIASEFMKGVIPAKTFECFATGKPLIVTGLDSFSVYADMVITGTYEEILGQLSNYSAAEDSLARQKRLQIAKANDWRYRIDQFERLLEVAS